MRTRYINMKSEGGEVETIDEFPFSTREERIYFREMLREYRMAYYSQNVYASSRCTKEWRAEA